MPGIADIADIANFLQAGLAQGAQSGSSLDEILAKARTYGIDDSQMLQAKQHMIGSGMNFSGYDYNPTPMSAATPPMPPPPSPVSIADPGYSDWITQQQIANRNNSPTSIKTYGGTDPNFHLYDANTQRMLTDAWNAKQQPSPAPPPAGATVINSPMVQPTTLSGTEILDFLKSTNGDPKALVTGAREKRIGLGDIYSKAGISTEEINKWLQSRGVDPHLFPNSQGWVTPQTENHTATKDLLTRFKEDGKLGLNELQQFDSFLKEQRIEDINALYPLVGNPQLAQQLFGGFGNKISEVVAGLMDEKTSARDRAGGLMALQNNYGLSADKIQELSGGKANAGYVTNMTDAAKNFGTNYKSMIENPDAAPSQMHDLLKNNPAIAELYKDEMPYLKALASVRSGDLSVEEALDIAQYFGKQDFVNDFLQKGPTYRDYVENKMSGQDLATYIATREGADKEQYAKLLAPYTNRPVESRINTVLGGSLSDATDLQNVAQAEVRNPITGAWERIYNADQNTAFSALPTPEGEPQVPQFTFNPGTVLNTYGNEVGGPEGSKKIGLAGSNQFTVGDDGQVMYDKPGVTGFSTKEDYISGPLTIAAAIASGGALGPLFAAGVKGAGAINSLYNGSTLGGLAGLAGAIAGVPGVGMNLDAVGNMVPTALGTGMNYAGTGLKMADAIKNKDYLGLALNAAGPAFNSFQDTELFGGMKVGDVTSGLSKAHTAYNAVNSLKNGNPSGLIGLGSLVYGSQKR